ncbi:MAG: RNA 2'-phosphotransferase [Eubacterium sp.]|nr:RNA 2'-phosphotransferase [Eubacterium sp.]
MNQTEKSKYMAMLLRHKPEKGNLKLDSDGFTDVDSLLKALEIDFGTLEEIVSNDNKQRYSFNKDKTRIRANQGHSVSYVKIKFKELIPSCPLYHGTALKFMDGINKKGLISKNRQYVHLSQDIETAKSVGMRHAKYISNLIIFEIDCQKMLKDGYKFYISDNNVVLTEKVPRKYLKQIQI